MTSGMSRFLVQLRGENCLLSLDGEHGKFAFNARRVIKAPSLEEAERIAIIRILQQLNKSEYIVKNTPDAPQVTVVSTTKLGRLSFVSKKQTWGFDFFGVDESSATENT